MATLIVSNSRCIWFSMTQHDHWICHEIIWNCIHIDHPGQEPTYTYIQLTEIYDPQSTIEGRTGWVAHHLTNRDLLVNVPVQRGCFSRKWCALLPLFLRIELKFTNLGKMTPWSPWVQKTLINSQKPQQFWCKSPWKVLEMPSLRWYASSSARDSAWDKAYMYVSWYDLYNCVCT